MLVEDDVAAAVVEVVAAEGFVFGVAGSAGAAAECWVALAVVVVAEVAEAVAELELAIVVVAAVDSGCWPSTG